MTSCGKVERARQRRLRVCVRVRAYISSSKGLLSPPQHPPLLHPVLFTPRLSSCDLRPGAPAPHCVTETQLHLLSVSDGPPRSPRAPRPLLAALSVSQAASSHQDGSVERQRLTLGFSYLLICPSASTEDEFRSGRCFLSCTHGPSQT